MRKGVNVEKRRGLSLRSAQLFSSVQLNARIAPETAVERDLQLLYSDLIEAVYGELPDERKAVIYLKEINRLIKG